MGEKIYVGHRTDEPDGLGTRVSMVRDGLAEELPLRLDLWKHSPQQGLNGVTVAQDQSSSPGPYWLTQPEMISSLSTNVTSSRSNSWLDWTEISGPSPHAKFSDGRR